VQFLHLDDLATAVQVVVVRRCGGAFNVAPDGWLEGEELSALRSARPRLSLPLFVAERIDRRMARRRRRPLPTGLLPYLMHPWVVANDRLRAEGWEAQSSSAEVFVVADEPPPWADLNARQRQALSLSAAGVVVVGLLGLAVWLVRRLRD
jgi:hypothetical protein